MNKGFTLIELLVVVGIVGILAVVVVTTINPAEILKQSRDAKRLSEVNSISEAIKFALSQDLVLDIGSSSLVYLSLPDSDPDCGSYTKLPVLLGSRKYRCASTANYRKIDGSGWLPVDFSSLATSPFSTLPVDPKNDADSGLYYSYTPQGSKWELNTGLESKKYSYGGSGDVASQDGGNLHNVYEEGSKLDLSPYVCGDVDWSGRVDNDDITALSDFVFNANQQGLVPSGAVVNLKMVDIFDTDPSVADGVDVNALVDYLSLGIAPTCKLNLSPPP